MRATLHSRLILSACFSAVVQGFMPRQQSLRSSLLLRSSTEIRETVSSAEPYSPFQGASADETMALKAQVLQLGGQSSGSRRVVSSSSSSSSSPDLLPPLSQRRSIEANRTTLPPGTTTRSGSRWRGPRSRSWLPCRRDARGCGKNTQLA